MEANTTYSSCKISSTRHLAIAHPKTIIRLHRTYNNNFYWVVPKITIFNDKNQNKSCLNILNEKLSQNEFYCEQRNKVELYLMLFNRRAG